MAQEEPRTNAAVEWPVLTTAVGLVAVSTGQLLWSPGDCSRLPKCLLRRLDPVVILAAWLPSGRRLQLVDPHLHGGRTVGLL